MNIWWLVFNEELYHSFYGAFRENILFFIVFFTKFFVIIDFLPFFRCGFNWDFSIFRHFLHFNDTIQSFFILS